jgi:PIN domain nuclease of toxin-antitoxin system
MGPIRARIGKVILLDTHAVIWLFLDADQLSSHARKAIVQARIDGEELACSPVSFYEIANAVRRKRLQLYSPTQDFITAVQAKLRQIPLTAEISICAAELPHSFHGDPMDRIIVATAIVNQCPLITHDDRIRKAKVCKVVW